MYTKKDSKGKWYMMRSFSTDLRDKLGQRLCSSYHPGHWSVCQQHFRSHRHLSEWSSASHVQQGWWAPVSCLFKAVLICAESEQKKNCAWCFWVPNTRILIRMDGMLFGDKRTNSREMFWQNFCFDALFRSFSLFFSRVGFFRLQPDFRIQISFRKQ